MGKVVRARHIEESWAKRQGGDVAIKLVHGHVDDDVTASLLAEARLAARIQHRNVVAVLEAGDSKHGVFLAMDYVEGDTLSGLIRAARKRDGFMPIQIVARILKDALTGLHAVHGLCDDEGRSRDVVHRDFSPQNILIGRDGVSKLTDFGIAKAMGSTGVTATGIIKGKIGYMSPEQARGEQIDRRSDVWAAGVVMWEALTAQRLFRGANDAATLLAVVSDTPPPRPSKDRPELSAKFDTAVAAALQQQRGKRLSTARAFWNLLEEAADAHGGVANHETVAEYVEEMVGATLDERREQARHVLTLRAMIADVSADAEAHVQTEATSSLGARAQSASLADVDVTMKHGVSTTARATAPAPRLWPAVLLFAVGAAAAVAYFTLVRDGSTNASDAQSASIVAAPDPTSPPLVNPVPTQSASAVAPRVLHIAANAPIAQLQLDEQTILLPEAVSELDLPISGDAPTRFRAVAADGSQVDLRLSAGQDRIRIDFPVLSQPAARRPAQAAPPTSGNEDPGLADSPYVP